MLCDITCGYAGGSLRYACTVLRSVGKISVLTSVSEPKNTIRTVYG